MTRHQQPLDYAPDDDPWESAHVIPDLDTGLDWRGRAAIALALFLAVGLIGYFAYVNAVEQTKTCMEGCP